MSARRTSRQGTGNRGAVYVRISRDSAARELGVQRQREMCDALALRLGMDVVGVYEDNDLKAKRDARTGKMAERPSYQRLLRDVAAGKVDAVLCSHQDRLVREPVELEELVRVLEGADVPVHMATAGSLDLTTATGKMNARVVGAFAAMESEQKAERVSAQKAQARKAGAWTGGRRPFGYVCARDSKGDATLEVVEAEAVWVRRMVAGILEERTLQSIADELNANGIPTPAGKATWRAGQVRSVVTKPLIAGYRTHEGAIVGDANWAPLVDRRDWARMTAVLSRPERKRNASKRRWLLTPWVQSEAGAILLKARSPGVRCKVGGNNGTAYYFVPGACANAEMLDRDVWEAVLLVTDALGVGVQDVTAEAETDLEAGIRELEGKRARLAKLYASGALDDEGYADAAREVKASLDALRAAQRDAQVDEVPASVLERVARPGALRVAWASGALTFAERRAVLGALVERIVVRDRWTKATDEDGNQERWTIVWR